MKDYFNISLDGSQLQSISSIGLAHLGDAVYELLVRSWLCAHGFSTRRPRRLSRSSFTTPDKHTASSGISILLHHHGEQPVDPILLPPQVQPPQQALQGGGLQIVRPAGVVGDGVDVGVAAPFVYRQLLQVLPGLFYHLPPAQEKADPLAVEPEEFARMLDQANPDREASGFLLDSFFGLSPLV